MTGNDIQNKLFQSTKYLVVGCALNMLLTGIGIGCIEVSDQQHVQDDGYWDCGQTERPHNESVSFCDADNWIKDSSNEEPHKEATKMGCTQINSRFVLPDRKVYIPKLSTSFLKIEISKRKGGM